MITIQMFRICCFLIIYLFSLLGCSAPESEQKVPPQVFFIEPLDGATVSSPVRVMMGVNGMEVRPISEGVVDGTGHHHILVNIGPKYPKGAVIPNDDINRHFGAGQTEAELDLEPGKYKLTLQFADANHRSFGNTMSHSIDITVE